jgi:hypothetical protein
MPITPKVILSLGAATCSAPKARAEMNVGAANAAVAVNEV